MAALSRCILGIVALAFFCAGCAPKNADMLHFLRDHRHEVSAMEYRLGIPDSVGISAPRIAEIDGEQQRIQPDGKINRRLLGEVKVVGMTGKELAAKLEVLLSRYYVDPKVSVRVLVYASKKYYVHGHALRGSRPYTGRDTLIDAVVASGVDYRSWTSRIRIIRPSHGETPVRTLGVNVDRMIREGDWSTNVLLEPNDIVYIPPTPLAWVGLRIRELLDPIGPLARAYTAPAYLANLDEAYDDDFRGWYGGHGRGY